MVYHFILIGLYVCTYMFINCVCVFMVNGAYLIIIMIVLIIKTINKKKKRNNLWEKNSKNLPQA